MSKERLRDVEIEPNNLNGFIDTFIPRFDVYPKQLDDGTYVSVKAPLTPNLIQDHLLGKITLGAYALDANSQAKYVCFDADDDDQWWGLQRMAQGLTEARLSPYLELSRRGGHLWLFTPLINGYTARAFASQLLSDWDIHSVEIYPKQNKLKSGVGSFVRLPFGVHRKTGKRYHFIDLTGNPIAPTIRDQITALASPTRIPQTYIDKILARVPKPKEKPLLAPNFRPARSKGTTLPLSEQIKRQMTVHQFVSYYVELDQNGRGHCPFHDDNHQSFSVNVDENYWHCFAGCGGGSIIDFWQKMRALHDEDPSFKATLHDLAKQLLK